MNLTGLSTTSLGQRPPRKNAGTVRLAVRRLRIASPTPITATHQVTKMTPSVVYASAAGSVLPAWVSRVRYALAGCSCAVRGDETGAGMAASPYVGSAGKETGTAATTAPSSANTMLFHEAPVGMGPSIT